MCNFSVYSRIFHVSPPLENNFLLHVVHCAIWYHFYNLKNVKSTHGGPSTMENTWKKMIRKKKLQWMYSKYFGANAIDLNRTKVYWGHFQTSMMELLCENSWQVYFNRMFWQKTSVMLWKVLFYKTWRNLQNYTQKSIIFFGGENSLQPGLNHPTLWKLKTFSPKFNPSRVKKMLESQVKRNRWKYVRSVVRS